MSAVVTAALREKGRGRQPIPIPPRQKKASTMGWPDLRLTPEEILKVFAANANMGILNGAPSGNQIDIDLDCREAQLLAQRLLPATDAIFGRASKRGSHRLYTCTDLPATTQYRDIDNGMLLEVRSTGTQTMFPPSIHPSGEEVTWESDGEPANVAGDDLVTAAARTAAASLLARHWPGEGSRQDAALALAGGLLRLGWVEDEVATFIEGVAQAADDEETASRVATVEYTERRLGIRRSATGWPRLAELVGSPVVTRARSWLGATESDHFEDSECGWELPIPLTDGSRPPFPTDLLPDWLRAYVDAVTHSTQTPPALAGLLVLSCLATACAKLAVVELSADWREPLNLYTVTALLPGERKSAVFAEVTRPLDAFEASERSRLVPTIAEAEGRRRIATQALTQAQNTAVKASAEERPALLELADTLARELAATAVPTRPQLVTEDCTPERLSSLLAEQDGCIAVLAPEGDVFDLMAGRYSASGEPNVGIYLKGHAGDTLRVDRVGRPGEFVEAPALSIGLTVQPIVLHGLAAQPQFRGRGLLARFLYALPESLVGSREIDPTPVPTAIRQAYDRNLTLLLRLRANTRANDHPDEAPRLRLSHEAATVFSAFRQELEPRLGAGGDLEAIQDWAGKLAGAVARIAGLLHLATHADLAKPWQTPIAPQTMLSAIRLAVSFLIPHAKMAFAQIGADPAVSCAAYLLRVLEKRQIGATTKRDLFQLAKGRYSTIDQLEPGLAILQQHGYLRVEVPPDRPGPGRKSSPAIVVNPLWQFGSRETTEDLVAALMTVPEAAPTPAAPSQNPQNPHNRTHRSERRKTEHCEDSERCFEQRHLVLWTSAALQQSPHLSKDASCGV